VSAGHAAPRIDDAGPSGLGRLALGASCAAAVVVIIWGMSLSKTRFKHDEWLSRAGRVVAMLGNWSGLVGIIQERLLTTGMRWRRRGARARARARLHSEGAGSASIAEKPGETDAAFEQQSAGMAQSLGLSPGVLEVSLLMTGTLSFRGPAISSPVRGPTGQCVLHGADRPRCSPGAAERRLMCHEGGGRAR